MRAIFLSYHLGDGVITGGIRYHLEIMQFFKKKGLALEVWQISEFKSKNRLWINLALIKKFHAYKKLYPDTTIVIEDPGKIWRRAFLANIYVTLFLPNFKIVPIMHHLESVLKKNFIKQTLSKLVEFFFLKFTWRIIANSKNTKISVSNLGISSKLIKVVNPGFEKQAFFNLAPNRDYSKCEHWLFLGTVSDSRKGFLYLLQAFKEIPQDIHLYVIGNTQYYPEHIQFIKKIVKDLELEKRVHFLGVLSEAEIKAQFAKADVFVLPSLWEGYGIVLAEAMAAGLPIISTKVGAIPELIEDGQQGLLVPPADIEKLSIAMKKIYNDAELRKQLGQAARARSKELYDWQDCCEHAWQWLTKELAEITKI